MAVLDDTDRKLIALLKQNARASVTTLASDLGLSRATVQARMERLTSDGVIQRYTVELDALGAGDLVRSVMMIALEANKERSVIRHLRRMPQVTSLHTTNGKWSLVAQIETQNLPEFDDVLREVRLTAGVLDSETCLLLDRAKY